MVVCVFDNNNSERKVITPSARSASAACVYNCFFYYSVEKQKWLTYGGVGRLLVRLYNMILPSHFKFPRYVLCCC